MPWRLAALLLAIPFQAAAQSAPVVVDLTYSGYKDGLRVLTAQSEMTLSDRGYRIGFSGHTTGVIGFFYHAHWQTWADGMWTKRGVLPLHFDNEGVFGGNARSVALKFANGDPMVQVLSPPDDGEQTPVPPGTTRNAIDSLSVTALLVRQMATLGTCGGDVRVFDGRSVTDMAIRRGGGDYLGPTPRSGWSGPTLRCDLYAHVVAGFFREDSPQAHDFVDQVWLATVLPGVPALPVRMTATTHHLGRIILYLTTATRRDVAAQSAKVR